MDITEAQTENNTVDPVLSLGLGCPKCGKDFKNAMALRMHDIRKHQKGWSTSQNFKGRKQGRESVLEKKREYNRRMRERFYKSGRNSRGQLMPKGWKPKFYKGGWSPERRAKFNSTWRSKAMKRAKKFTPIVYSDPFEKTDQKELAAVHVPTLKYCPNCGEHIEGWRHQP